MTSTASFKDKLKQAFSFFQWELKSCAGTLTIYSILTAVFMVIILTLCLAIGITMDNSLASTGVTGSSAPIENFSLPGFMFSMAEDEVQPSGFAMARLAFQYLSFYMVYFMTVIFTIIYTVKVFMYLHNKRQTDMYGSMPVSRITLFFSKSATAFIFSVVPAMVFFGISAFISIIMGQPLMGDNAMIFVRIIMGSLACISAYGLIAVCCGTTINSILMFIAVSVVYPMSALFVRGVMDSFYIGSSSDYLNNSFIMNAFCPLSAYDGNNIIYWLIFTAVCLAASAYLVKNRRAERAQSSFAYYLPCHIVKVLVSFLAGMFLGVIFGSLNVFGYGFAGFVFGFILASIPAFIVCHLIFYHGFHKIVRTSVTLGALIVIVIGAMAFVNFDVTGYNKFVPEVDKIESAGFIDGQHCYVDKDKTSLNSIIKDANSDFNDESRLSATVELHKNILKNADNTSTSKFSRIWINILSSSMNLEGRECEAFSYKMKNGRVITRKFNVYMMESYDSDLAFSEDFPDVFSENDDVIDSLIKTKEYQQKYSAFLNADFDELNEMYVSGFHLDYDGYSLYREYSLNDDYENKSEKLSNDRKKILDAYIKDFEADTKDIDEALFYASKDDIWIYRDAVDLSGIQQKYSDYVCIIDLGYNNDYNKFFYYGSYEKLVVPKSYTNTIQALKDVGILDSDGKPNEKSPYYDDYDDEYSYYDDYDMM